MRCARGTGVLLSMLLVVAACDAGSTGPGPPLPSTAAGPTGAADLDWRACGDDANWSAAGPSTPRRDHLDVTCATLAVPLDHTDPSAGTVGLALVRVRDDRQHDRIGSLVLNPGGPAASGLDSMPIWATWFPDSLLGRFDLVTFDPRGTGQSQPLDCPDTESGGAPDVRTPAGYREVTSRIASFYAGCARHLGSTAGAFGTDAVARDLDLLRQALGDERLTFVGWSYGARLGAHYAHLFPDRVRALVLDAPPDPEAATVAVVDAQLDGFEAALADWAATCGSRDTCVGTGDPRRLLARVREKARSTGIPSGRPAGDDPADEDLVLRATLGLLAHPSTWSALDLALGEADRGDSGSLHDVIDGLEGSTPAHPEADTDTAMAVVQCTDSPRPPSPRRLRSDVQRLARTYPTFGQRGSTWPLLCAGWPDRARHPLPLPTTTTSADILVVAGAADPSTPISGARALVRALGPSSTLLVSTQAGHTSFGSSACVDEHVAAYLLAAQTPTAGTRCA